VGKPRPAAACWKQRLINEILEMVVALQKIKENLCCFQPSILGY
jgi:hypothetical protein